MGDLKFYKADQDVITTVQDLIAKYHPHLALCDQEIAIIFKDKATLVGDVLIAGKTSKASELFALLGDIPWKFIITLAADHWSTLSDPERVALLDHHLCGCKVEESKQHVITYKVVPPDVAFYKGEIERHGLWRTSGAPPSPTLTDEIFGTKAP